MLKICGDSICRPISTIFNTYLCVGKFPLEYKKDNVVPIKGDKQTVRNYLPVSLLSIYNKIIERLLYHETLNFL